MNDDAEEEAHQHEFIIGDVGSCLSVCPVIICTDNVFDGYQGAEDMDGEEDEMIEGDMEADMSDMGDMDGKLRHVATRDTLTDICSPPFPKQETVSTSTRKMTTTKVMVTWTTRRVQKSLKKCKRSSQSVFFWKVGKVLNNS
jgi:hypothetical protein